MSRDLPELRTLDLGNVKGVREHFDSYGEIPTLVFRDNRQVGVIINPFPGIWKLTTPAIHRSLIPGTNTLDPAIELVAGERVMITPILSAIAPSGPVVQVAMELNATVQELALPDDLPDLPGLPGLADLDALEPDEEQPRPDVPTDDEIQAAFDGALDEPAASEHSTRVSEMTPTLSCRPSGHESGGRLDGHQVSWPVSRGTLLAGGAQ